MKTNLITRTLAVLTIVLGFAMTTVAQQGANSTINGLANVVAQVTVTSDGSLQFGNITPGNTKTISTTGTVAVGTAAGTNEAQGKFIVTKGANSQVTLGFTLPTNLTSDLNLLPVNFLDYTGNKCGRIALTGQTDVPFTPASGISTANSDATIWVFAASTFNVHIGGTVIPAVDQPSGSYTGDIILTATYN